MKSINNPPGSSLDGQKKAKPKSPPVSIEEIKDPVVVPEPDTVAEAVENSILRRKAKEIINALPDVRKDKVQKLKEQIKAGKYQVDAEAVAEKLIADHLKLLRKKET